MKDNFPNYLNYHGIDPGRVEPARIDRAPGFDSVRPDRRVGTVCVVGYSSESRLRHFVEQPPTMSNADAISVLKNIETDIYGRIAISKAIGALIGPWVRTADRLPTKDDVDSRMNVMAWHIWYGAEIVDYGAILDDPSMYVWWATMPTWPEEVYR